MLESGLKVLKLLNLAGDNMKLILLKAKIYQYTGIYLAAKEELDYVTSRKFWKEFNKQINRPDNDMSHIDIQGLLIGSWQTRHGFYRIFDTKYYLKSKNNWFYRIYRWCRIFLFTLKSDLRIRK